MVWVWGGWFGFCGRCFGFMGLGGVGLYLGLFWVWFVGVGFVCWWWVCCVWVFWLRFLGVIGGVGCICYLGGLFSGAVVCFGVFEWV